LARRGALSSKYICPTSFAVLAKYKAPYRRLSSLAPYHR
jgi:hypothetical protein